MTEQYVGVPKSMLLDKKLSLRAKGLYALILSLPTSWHCSVQYLTEETGMSKHMTWKAVKELENHRYLERCQITDENGCFAGMEYVLKESGYNDT